MVMPDGLTTRYKCDETSGTTLTDSVGTKHGTLTGTGINFTYDASIKRYVLSKDLNNVDTYVSIPLLFSVKDYSVGFWKKFTDTDSMVWHLRFDNNQPLSYTVWASQSEIRIQRNNFPYNQYVTYISTNDSRYHHFGFSMKDNGDSSGNIKFYVNGKLIGTHTIPSGTWVTGTPSHNILLSQKTLSSLYYHGAGRFFEFCFFDNKVLSDDEFNKLYFVSNPYPKNNEYSIFDSCVAFYDFKKDAKDVIGSNDGTVTGATLTTNHLGQANSAYSFDGVDDIITLTSTPISSNNAWSISVWVNGNADGSGTRFFTFGNSATDQAVFGNFEPTGNISLDIWNRASVNTSAGVYSLGTWGHIVYTYDGAKGVKIYCNSIEVKSETIPNNLNIGSTLKQFGKSDGAVYYKGLLSIPIVFNKALSADEVKQLYDLTKNKVIYPIVRGGRK